MKLIHCRNGKNLPRVNSFPAKGPASANFKTRHEAMHDTVSSIRSIMGKCWYSRQATSPGNRLVPWITDTIQSRPIPESTFCSGSSFSSPHIEQHRDNIPDLQHTWGINIHLSPTNQIKEQAPLGSYSPISQKLVLISNTSTQSEQTLYWSMAFTLKKTICPASQRRCGGRCPSQHCPGYCVFPKLEWTSGS